MLQIIFAIVSFIYFIMVDDDTDISYGAEIDFRFSTSNKSREKNERRNKHLHPPRNWLGGFLLKLGLALETSPHALAFSWTRRTCRVRETGGELHKATYSKSYLSQRKYNICFY